MRRMLRKTRVYAVVLIFVAAMVIAPHARSCDDDHCRRSDATCSTKSCIWIAWGMDRRAKRLALRDAIGGNVSGGE